MDLGALVCTSRNPHCGACPFQPHCLAFAHGLQDELPRRKASKARPHYIVTAGVIWDAAGDQLLVAQRPTEGMLGGLWEFPGGKQETGETLQAALRRELREEMAIEVAVGDELVVIDHAYTHFSITLHAFHCTHIGGEPQRLGVADFRWLHPDELAQLAWPSTDQRILEALLSEKRNGNAERVTQSQEN